MSMPPKKALRRGIPQLTPALRAAVVDHYIAAYEDITGDVLTSPSLPPLQRGRNGDPVVNAAYQRFLRVYACDGYLKDLPRELKRETYISTLHKYYAEFFATRKCTRKSRKKVVNLTDAESKRLAELLAKPIKKGENIIRFNNLEEAKALVPEVADLCSKSHATTPVLHKWLLENNPTLQYEPEDRVPRLTPSTRKARQKCADIWRGERHWFKQKRVLRPHSKDGNPQHDTQKSVYWDPAWYGPYTFMLDATSFCDREGPMHSQAPRVYSDSNHIYPPTPVEPDKSISQSTTIMVYAVIHKHLGLVVGPDIMLTGTKLKQTTSDTPKEKQMDDAGVKTWWRQMEEAGEFPALDAEYQYDHRNQDQFAKCGGERAGGFVATEFQEWFRLRALPKIKECARQNFTAHNHPPWFKQSHYESMCGKIGHHIDGSDPLFFIAQVSDPRHSMRYFWQSIDAEEKKPKHKPKCKAKRKAKPTPPPLRPSIPDGQPGHIPISLLFNFVPTAPKVPDAVQFPIESMFAPVKQHYSRLSVQGKCDTPAKMVQAIREAFAEKATPEHIHECFRHGEENMRIFMGTEDQVVQLGEQIYQCTHGGSLPKDRRA